MGYSVLLLLENRLVGEQQRADGAGCCSEGSRQHGLDVSPLLYSVAFGPSHFSLRIVLLAGQSGGFSFSGQNPKAPFLVGHLERNREIY